MAAACVDDYEAVAGGGEVEAELFDDRLGRVSEIDRDDPSRGAGHLVHEAAGLAEVFVLGKLANLCDRDRIGLHVIK